MSAASRKGASFERDAADWLAARLGDDRIDRRVKRGTNDTGDIGGIRTPLGGRVVVEVKNQARMELAAWVDEAERERGNDDATVGVVLHKRRGRGVTRFGENYVTLTVEGFARLIEGGQK